MVAALLHGMQRPLASTGVAGAMEILIVTPVLILSVLIGAGLLVTLHSKPEASKSVGKVLVAIVVVAVGLAGFAFVMRSARAPGYGTLYSPTAVPDPVAATVTRWESAADLGCASDEFPSMSSAAEGLTANLLRCLRARGGVFASGSSLGQDLLADTRRVWISCEASDPLRQELNSAIAARVAHMLPAAAISSDAPASRPAEAVEPDELLITAMVSGTTVLNIRMRVPDMSVSGLGRVRDLPWVEDPSAFCRAQSGRVSIYRSANAHSRDDALRMALASASAELQPRLARRLGTRVDCTQVLMGDLRRQAIVKDYFVQPLQTNAGPTLYRAAVLMDTSDYGEVKLAQLASDYQIHQRSQALMVAGSVERAKWVGLLVIGLLTVVIYLVVNSMGRRYYVAVLIGAGAVVSVLLALA